MAQSDSSTAALSVAGPKAKPPRRRAACDECRAKKLKCNGEQPACVRCAREGITCIYSAQKQMGRPKKRVRTEDDPRSKPSRSPRSDLSISNLVQPTDLQASTNDVVNDDPSGGTLQPWSQIEADWLEDYGHAMPSLTPDDGSSRSPPLLDLPPELRSHSLSRGMQGSLGYPASSASLLLEPAIAGPQGNDMDTPKTGSQIGCHVTPMPACACLSTIYLTLNALQAMDDNFAFPFALHPLREAVSTTSTVLTCSECPKRFITGLQNTQLVGTLILSIAERFSKVLEHITSESIRADFANETKQFRLADLNTATSHLHTGGLGCAAAFNLDLTADEWRSMCKKVVKAEVHGTGGDNACCCSFTGVLKQMEDRQELWHRSPLPSDYPTCEGRPMFPGSSAMTDKANENEHSHEPGVKTSKGMNKTEPYCLKAVGFARRLVDSYDWS